MSDSNTNKSMKFSDAPADKMAELEDEIERQDAEQHKEADISKYAPKPEGVTVAIGHPSQEVKAEARQAAPPRNKEEQVPVAKDEPANEEPDVTEEQPADDEKQEDKENDEAVLAEATEKKDSSLWWNICIAFCFMLLAGMAYLYFQQKELLPPDPLEKAKAQYQMVKDAYDRLVFESVDTQHRAIRNQVLLLKGQELANLKQETVDGEKRIETLEKEILGLRGQMKAYYSLYKEHARKNARTLHFDSLTTVNTKKTYLNVNVQRVTDQGVSIVHAGGVVTLKPSDLSEALQIRFAYGDPLGLANMEKEQAEEEVQKQNVGKYLPELDTDHQSPATGTAVPARRPVNNEALLKGDFDPPTKLPNVDTKPGRNEAPAREQSVDDILNDGWVPPNAPIPMGE